MSDLSSSASPEEDAQKIVVSGSTVGQAVLAEPRHYPVPPLPTAPSFRARTRDVSALSTEHVISQISPEVLSNGEKSEQQQVPEGPGVLILTAGLNLIYMDKRARHLCALVNFGLTGHAANGVLPKVVTGLCSDIAKAIDTETAGEDWEDFQMGQIVQCAGHAVLLRGYAMPGRNSQPEGRILVLIEEWGTKDEIPSKKAVERFHLGARETAAIRYLAKGYTNKQIANELQITEQSVKERIKRVMYKTKTATRTALLMELMRW